jgi:beta-N-acetylhexosaminidase
MVVTVRPENLTPADTSAEVELALASAIEKRHPNTRHLTVGYRPRQRDIESAISTAAAHDLVIVGTYDATPEQAALVNGLVDKGLPTVTVALRTPYDVASYPVANTNLATYGILEPSMEALAGGLFGEFEFQGRLPVSIPGIAAVGHRHR